MLVDLQWPGLYVWPPGGPCLYGDLHPGWSHPGARGRLLQPQEPSRGLSHRLVSRYRSVWSCHCLLAAGIVATYSGDGVSIGHVTLAFMSEIFIPVTSLCFKFLQLIWRLNNRRWIYLVRNRHVGCRNLSTLQGTRIVTPIRVPYHMPHRLIFLMEITWRNGWKICKSPFLCTDYLQFFMYTIGF